MIAGVVWAGVLIAAAWCLRGAWRDYHRDRALTAERARRERLVAPRSHVRPFVREAA